MFKIGSVNLYHRIDDEREEGSAVGDDGRIHEQYAAYDLTRKSNDIPNQVQAILLEHERLKTLCARWIPYTLSKFENEILSNALKIRSW